MYVRAIFWEKRKARRQIPLLSGKPVIMQEEEQLKRDRHIGRSGPKEKEEIAKPPEKEDLREQQAKESH